MEISIKRIWLDTLNVLLFVFLFALTVLSTYLYIGWKEVGAENRNLRIDVVLLEETKSRLEQEAYLQKNQIENLQAKEEIYIQTLVTLSSDNSKLHNQGVLDHLGAAGSVALKKTAGFFGDAKDAVLSATSHVVSGR